MLQVVRAQRITLFFPEKKALRHLLVALASRHKGRWMFAGASAAMLVYVYSLCVQYPHAQSKYVMLRSASQQSVREYARSVVITHKIK